MRLANKVVLLTGGAGGIGRVIADRCLNEGATLILTGRTESKLQAAIAEITQADPKFKDKVFAVAMDGSKPASLEAGAKKIEKQFGRVDVLINNAGSAGPRQELAKIPLTQIDLERLRANGSTDTETLSDAIGSLLGSPWFTTKAVLHLLSKGASIINVSTIFSRTEYYGRIPYVMPKAALNSLSKILAKELGLEGRGIRVNTVYPGPVESERIHSVFETMDRLKGAPAGTTKGDVVGAMYLQKPCDGRHYLSKEEIADTIVFLSTNESGGFTGHDFEVTHGLQPPKDRLTHVISRPNLRVVDLEGKLVWIIAGDQVEDACTYAERHHELGADVFLTFRDTKAFETAHAKLGEQPGYMVGLLDPLNPDHWQKAEATLYLKHQIPKSVLVLPSYGTTHFSGSALEAPNAKIQEFFDTELTGAIAIAQKLDQLFGAADKRLTSRPVVIFASNGPDLNHKVWAKLRRAGLEQLIRVWRHENQLMVKAGRRHNRIHVNQLVRFENQDAINLDLACEWAISLSNGLRAVRAVDLALAPQISGAVQSRVALTWERQALRGLHLRKVALITGGSEGIGGETARLLALAGARVVIAARSLDKLEKARQNIIEELKIAGYADPEARVLIIPDCDVADDRALEQMIEQTMSRFGRLDYLINNAGVSGVEQMVVDMPPEGWQRTISANLTSNYDLMMRALPYMKKQKHGHILNVSSHFGGVRHATVAYPNRADYAVSKAGQRAMAEAISGFLGPDVQINAVAPGPVDGVRLRGTAERPGLYHRRAKLILENKRMNVIYGALVAATRVGIDLTGALAVLSENTIKAALTSAQSPEPLKILAQALSENPSPASSGQYLLTKVLAERLLQRLSLGAFLPVSFQSAEFFSRFKEPTEPFIALSDIEKDSLKIRTDVLNTLALARMPSENDVAREMVFYLANRNVTGETLHPSCGLMLERLVTSGEFVGRLHPDILKELREQSVAILGNSMFTEMAKLAGHYLSSGAKRVAIVAGSDAGRKQIETELEKMGVKTKANGTPAHPALFLATSPVTNGSLDSALATIIQSFGRPSVVVSFPTGTLPIPATGYRNKPAWESLPSTEEFKKLMTEQIFSHMMLGRRASTLDHCRIIFVTPRVTETAAPQTQAMARFIRTTLRPLTVTAGQEGGRLTHKPVFNQVDIASASETFIEAILLMSLPPAPTSGGKEPVKTSTGATITV